MADQQEGGHQQAMASEEEVERSEIAFSFMDKVRFMMYGEQEKEAFLIEKKEKEEKKKAKKALKAEKERQKKDPSSFGKVKEEPQSPESSATGESTKDPS